MSRAPRKKKTLNAKKAMQEADAAREARADTTLLMPPTKTVQELAREKRRTKKRLSEISGEHGSSVKAAADKKHLDKTAFSIATRLDALSDDKLAVTLPHLRRYIDDLELDKRATAQGKMFETDDAGEGEGEPGDAQRPGPVLVAGREVDEAAGAAQH